MTQEEVGTLKNGVYRVYWKDTHGGGCSVAAVGGMHNGQRWLAPSNWTAGPGFCPVSTTSWDAVDHVELLEVQASVDDVASLRDRVDNLEAALKSLIDVTFSAIADEQLFYLSPDVVRAEAVLNDSRK